MKFELKEFNRNISDTDLLDDLRKVAKNLKTNNLSSREYENSGGKYTSGTIGIRFGSWNNALEKAGLTLTLKHNPSEIELFKNMEEVWIKLGRQPVTRDMKRPLSKFSPTPYLNKFKSFRSALESFIHFINEGDDIIKETDMPEVVEIKTYETTFVHKTKRLPSERLKVQVLMRDGNKCRLCGITVTGENIHFDHILPWSKGGETTLENLQVLCEIHNLAKGNFILTDDKES
jgi:hypothetical protein